MKSGNAQVHPILQTALAQVAPKPGPDVEVTINLLQLSNLHAFISGAYRRALEAQTAARAAELSAGQIRTELYVALANIEDQIEEIESNLGIHATKYLTKDGYRCPDCGKHEVADAEMPCSICGARLERG